MFTQADSIGGDSGGPVFGLADEVEGAQQQLDGPAPARLRQMCTASITGRRTGRSSAIARGQIRSSHAQGGTVRGGSGCQVTAHSAE